MNALIEEQTIIVNKPNRLAIKYAPRLHLAHNPLARISGTDHQHPSPFLKYNFIPQHS
jgi:hypothetical protein